MLFVTHWGFHKMKNLLKIRDLTEIPILSEVLEPKLAQCIGILWSDVERQGRTEEAYKIFWHKLRALELFVITCNAPHASLAFSNNLGKVEQMIKWEFGFYPQENWRKQ